MPFIAAGLGACGIPNVFRRTRTAPPPPFRSPLQAPLTYVAIGASDAVGFGVANPRRDGWVSVLASQLPQPARLVNLGIGGITLRHALEAELPGAIEAQPNLVTIWLVVNDVLSGVPLDRYRADLDHLLSELRTKTKAVVAIGNAPYPPAHMDPWGVPDFVRRTLASSWNSVIAGAVRKHDAILVDLYNRWSLNEHSEFIGADGLHPTVAGYHALAGAFLETLREQRVV